MRLAFFAKADLLVPIPGALRFIEQPDRYVGRVYSPTAVDGKPGYPATEEPFACDSASEEGMRLAQLTRRDGDLIPADQQTADFCGLPFVPHRFLDGVHVPVLSQE